MVTGWFTLSDPDEVLASILKDACDGTFNVNAPAFYGAKTILDLITYENVQLTYKKYLDVGLHYNTQWTADPNTQATTPGDKSYGPVSQAHLTVVGAQAKAATRSMDGWTLAASSSPRAVRVATRMCVAKRKRCRRCARRGQGNQVPAVFGQENEWAIKKTNPKSR